MKHSTLIFPGFSSNKPTSNNTTSGTSAANSMSKTNILSTVMTTSVVVLGMLMSQGANAASACKGLDSSACDSATACGWVNGYERKDGRTVKSFCRAKAKSKAKSSTKDKLKNNIDN